MFRIATPLIFAFLLSQVTMAQDNASKADLYCSIYKGYMNDEWSLIKTHALFKSRPHVEMMRLPLERSTKVTCGIGLVSSSLTSQYMAIGCRLDSPLGDILPSIISNSLSAAQSHGAQGNFKDYDGDEYQLRCGSTPPEQTQKFLLNDFAYNDEAVEILNRIQTVTKDNSDSAKLVSSDGIFVLECGKNGADTKCSAEIVPVIATNERSTGIGVKGIGNGVDFARIEFRDPIDVSLFQRLLNGKSQWNSQIEFQINKFGAETESLHALTIECGNDVCAVTINDYLLLDR